MNDLQDDLYYSNMPEDLIPYWVWMHWIYPKEMNIINIKTNECIVSINHCFSIMRNQYNRCSNPVQYNDYTDRMLESLESLAYRAELGINGNFLLIRQNVGSIPHNSEIDVPFNYADYYLLEALKGKRI